MINSYFLVWYTSNQHPKIKVQRPASSSSPLSFTYIDSRLLLVPSQDPDLDVGLHQSLNGLGHLILKFILYCCGAQELQVLHQKWKEKKKSLSGDQNRKGGFKTSCVRETCRQRLFHSFGQHFTLISCSCLSLRKTTKGFSNFGECIWVSVSAHTSVDLISFTQMHPQIKCVFPREA